MKRFAVAALMLLIVAVPSFSKTHDETYSVPCGTLWTAVKDTLRNSGKYGVMSMENAEMSASYSIGIGPIGQKRVNSVALNSKGDGCAMAIQSGFSGFGNDDAGDFKKRVDGSLAKLKSSPPPPATPAKPEDTPK